MYLAPKVSKRTFLILIEKDFKWVSLKYADDEKTQAVQI